MISLRLLCSIAFTSAIGLSASSHPGHPANDVEILVPPKPEYPPPANWLGMEGNCDVRFSLHEYGSIVRVHTTACTSPVFCAAAAKSVRDAKFKVVDVLGADEPGVRTELVYPLEFRRYGESNISSKMQDCVARLIS